MRTGLRMGVRAMVTAAMLGGAITASAAELTGTVADAMCGAKHMMANDAAGCTQACVKKGSDYALVVGDKVYTLKGSNAVKAELDKLAGKTAKVVGDVKDLTVQVTSVQAAK